MKKEEINKIKTQAEDFLKEFGLPFSLEINYQKQTNVLYFQIDSEQPASLIGYHGDVIYSLQIIFSFLVHRILGQWIKVYVNVGDYRQKKEEQLKNLALNLATKVKYSQEPQIISNLTAAERRIIHLTLANHPDVYTESEGEGESRHLVVKPKIS